MKKIPAYVSCTEELYGPKFVRGLGSTKKLVESLIEPLFCFIIFYFTLLDDFELFCNNNKHYYYNNLIHVFK